MSSEIKTYLIHISGLVQGVGFRPFVWQVANNMGLKGCVYNDSEGVKIHLNASHSECENFQLRLENELPPLARIDWVNSQLVEPASYLDFNIVASKQGEVATGCAPDAATCKSCLNELFDPANRRYRYPFINCTDCGPRLSIVKQIPYDREWTTMSGFDQCSECLKEYNNPANRRFHAQPNACAQCGPQVWLEDGDGSKIETVDFFALLANAIEDGKIVAIKGLGGFHLACDATNERTVAELRARKHRPDKAFALMVRDLDTLGNYAQVDSQSEALISSSMAPAVLLNSAARANPVVADNVAPGQYQLAFMLPYTPIHHLLFENIDYPLVMTSGNSSGSPQAIFNSEAREQLSEIADLFLMHDRPIQNRVDDSVVRQVGDELQYLRRARGYAPGSMPLPPGFENAPEIVALGGELKNTLCLLQSGRAVITQHLGDLEDFRTYEQYQKTLELYQNLYQFGSDKFVCDLHPEYLSSKFGEGLAEQGKELSCVQHHHAHMASCLGDNQYPLSGQQVLGICLDGTGYGEDHTLWGGEFLLGGYQSVQRVAHLKPFHLVGGVQAIIEPWRCLFAQLRQAFPGQQYQRIENLWPILNSPLCSTFEKMIEKNLNCPITSSAGRLFDAVAAALGCHEGKISYEGQAAIELETLASSGDPEVKPYSFNIQNLQINPETFWHELTDDLINQSKSKADMAMAFHKGFANSIVGMAELLRSEHDFHSIALSGGVMQNAILYQLLRDQLKSSGFIVLAHKNLPANDAGLSFGQALIAASRLLN